MNLILKPIVSIIIIAFASSNPAHAQDEETQKTIEFLIIQNEQSLNQINSAVYQYEEEVERNDSRGAVTFNNSAKVHRKGPLISVWRTSPMFFNDEATARPTETRSVLNDSYFAAWINGSQNAQQIDHERIDTQSDNSLNMLSTSQGLDPLDLAFGLHGFTLRELIKSSKGRSRWDVKEIPDPANDATMYELSQYRNNDTEHPATVFVINPQQGFLVSKIKSYKKGEIRLEIDVSAESIDDIWFPETIVYKRHRRTDDGRLNTDTIRTVFSSVTLNGDIDDEQFTVASLDLPDETHLVRTHTNGDISSEVMLDRKLVDADLVRLIERSERELKELPSLDTPLSESSDDPNTADHPSAIKTSLPVSDPVESSGFTYKRALPIVVIALVGILLVAAYAAYRLRSKRKEDSIDIT